MRVDAEIKDTENNENEINGNGNGKNDGLEDWMETGEEEEERKIKETLALMNGQSGGKLDSIFLFFQWSSNSFFITIFFFRMISLQQLSCRTITNSIAIQTTYFVSPFKSYKYD